MVKILVVTNSLSGGGAERTMNTLANLLHANDYDVTIFPINHGSADAVKNTCQVLPPIRDWKSGLIPTVLSLFKFRDEVLAISPDLLIINCELPEFFSILLPRRIKLICVEHTSHPWRSRKILGTFVRLLLRLKGAQWVLVSSHLKNRMEYRKPIEIIPNLISNSGQQLAPHVAQTPKLIFIGRLSHEKDPALFVEIVNALGMSGLIIGQGILFDAVLGKIQSSNLSIKLLGQLENPWENIHDKDIIVITSKYEGDGLVLIEAMLRGLAVLVRDIPDLRRFNLPEANYFQSSKDAAERISEYLNKGRVLTIPTETTEQILVQRNEYNILNAWTSLIAKTIAP